MMKGIRTLIFFVLIAALLFSLSACGGTPALDATTFPTETPISIDWTLYGTLVTGAGEVTETLELSIRGTVALGEDGCDTLELDIVLPESFTYKYNGPATYLSENRKYFPELPYCVCPTYSFVPSLNDSVFSVFALSLEKEFVIFNWEDGVDVYLVASTNPDADPQEILAFFDGFIEEYVIDD